MVNVDAPQLRGDRTNEPTRLPIGAKNLSPSQTANAIVVTGCNPDRMPLLCGYIVFYRTSQTYGMRCLAKTDGYFVAASGWGRKIVRPSYSFRLSISFRLLFFHASGMNRLVENVPPKNINLGEVAHLPLCIVATGYNPDGMRLL